MFIKTKVYSLFTMLVLFASNRQATAQGAQFYRIVGPTAAAITAFNPDGTLVWSNAQPGATYTIQTTTSLPGATNWVDYVQILASSSVNTNLLIAFNPPAGMALIPAGSFTMGDTLDGDTNALPVTVTISGFYMEKNMVSYTEWEAVYIWATNHGYGNMNIGAAKATSHPVQTVSWYDAVKWCNARSQIEGLTPVYYTDAAMTKIDTNSYIQPTYANWAVNGYRLPTEAEWEKAARGGLSGQRFPWGDISSESLANYFGNPPLFSYDLGPISYNATFKVGVLPYTSPGGSFGANGYGLYDMAGNLDEWCWDTYATPYAGGTDPHGPLGAGFRVLRGGDWGSYPNAMRCACRRQDTDAVANDQYGFRCARGL